MRKILCIIVVVMLTLTMDLRAQSDGFFLKYYEYKEKGHDEWGELLLLPDKHNVDYDYPADNAPLDTGLLIMSGIGVAYANCKRNKNKNKL